jgi:hypothetical protein
MEYAPLKTMNPSLDDITINSSAWLSARGIMPGKGNENVSVPHFLIQNSASARTVNFSDLYLDGLLGLDSSQTIINLSGSVGSLTWNGCWAINNQVIIGHCTIQKGIVAPFNTFNMGYRYKLGWRPNRVS